MNTLVISKKKSRINNEEVKKLQVKSMILDDLVEFIEDKYFGYSMYLTENEINIPLVKAKKQLR